MAATVSTQLTSTTSPSSTGSCQSSTLPPLTELSSPASKLIQKQLSTATTIISPSSSISSLFERVTNFRRSLIKSNLHKKCKSSRPQSASFNLFYGNNKSLTRQEINGKCLKETMNRKDNKMVTKCSTLSTASETYGFYDDIENTPTSLNNISTMTTTTIHVDEEDAIYGFTSMNLNNPTKRQLKQPSMMTPPPSSTDTTKTTATTKLTSSPLSSSSSSTSTSSLSNVNKYSSSLLKQALKSKNDQLLTSSSCISLYETIDECETDHDVQTCKPNQAINGGDGEGFQQNSKALPSKKSYLSKFYCPTMNNYQHNRFHNQPNVWNRNRRTSAILFANNQSEFEQINSQQKIASNKMNHHYQRKEPVKFHGQQNNSENFQYSCSSLQSRSSDDILMITSSSIGNSSNSLVKSARIYENITNNRNKNGHRTSYFPDPRKLTKDSGYESSSTLISLNKNSNTITKHTSSGYGILNTPLINQNFDHSRSDSVDSNISHKSFELLSNNLALPTSFVPTSPESHDEQEDSPPPTPPIRYSSLPENNQQKSTTLSSEDKQTQRDICSTNLEKSSWPYNLYPKMRRKLLKYQQQQQQPPPPSSPLPESNFDDGENLYDNELIPPSQVSSNQYLLSNHTPELVTQLVRSHRVQSAVKQEISLPSTTTNNYNLTKTSNLLPPILPPKNQFQNHYNIKEIQKRAVYEFYLRQKEKKRIKNDKTEPDKLVKSSNNLDKSKDIYSNIETISKCEEESLPLPAPPPPLPSSNLTNGSFSLSSKLCSESVKYSMSIIPNNLSFTQQKSPLEIINERYQFNLMQFWPLVNIGQLMSTLVVVFNNSDNNNNNNDDDDNEHESELSPALDSINQEEPTIEQELIRIDQTRKLKHRMLSRKNLLLMEQTRIEHNLSELETIGIFVRDKLEVLDKMQKNKLDLITIDMVRIIGLIFSIHQQINECNRRQLRNISEENNNPSILEDNLARLKRQLLEARQLRDGIEQRCLMFIERIKSRFDEKVKFEHFPSDNNENNQHHQDESNKIVTILATLNEYKNKSSLEDDQKNIGTYQNDFNLSSLSQFYLSTMEMLTIQQQLIHFLINQEMINVLEQ